MLSQRTCHDIGFFGGKSAHVLITEHECEVQQWQSSQWSWKGQTRIKRAELMVDASTAEGARQIILGDLAVDAASYDDDLRPVEEGT